ncbi:VOC family protein [Inquilinus limosus]|uniref:VOC family protein n=1 Tax=Inquilinus limosus TaxID=171674 RepID=UPI003F189999
MPEHGTFCWNELNTRDPEAACDFYAKTLGWRFETMPMATGGNYIIAKIGDRMVGGVLDIRGHAGMEEVPPNWFAYIEVDDIDARVEAARQAGATVLRDIFEVPGVGRIAIIQDPTGAVAGWMTSAPQAG